MRSLCSHRFKRTTLYLLLFLGILGGIGLARAGPGLGLVGVGGVLPFLALSLRRQGLWTALLVVIFGISLGWWRGLVYLHKQADYEPWFYQKITITARASEDAVYGKTKQLTFLANGVATDDGSKLTGKVQLNGFGVNAVFQGDEVKATGKLYPGYGNYQARMSFAKLVVIKHHPSLVAEIRRRFAAGMQTALPQPLAPFAMGLLVGQRATLPDDVKQDLLMVGLTHIIAVSGYNLTIILRASKHLLAKYSKRLSTLLSLALIAVFLLLAGASASIVRAAIVSVLSIWASYYGRSFKPLLLIAFAAAITAWANPFYVWSDLSWYLSFLAFYGVMVISPLVQKRLPGTWHKSLAGSVAIESICAEIMSLPFVLYIFGQMSLIGLPANVMVVTLIPLAMLLSTVAGLAGMLAGAVAGWFAWPAALLLNYMLSIAHLMASLPHVFIQNRSLSLKGMLGLYLVIVYFSLVLRHKVTARAGIITDTNERT